MLDSRYSDNEVSRRDIPSFIEPRPPLISNPFMRPRPQKGTNLLELFEEDSECEEPELVQVYLRLKPCNNPSNLYEVRSDRHLITSLDTTTAGHGRRTQHNVSKMFTFSHIFGPDTSQKEIFENVVKENLKKLPEGNSFTLLTYGASGSGKTFTLMGTVASPGLVPRSLEYVFKVVGAAQTPVYKPSESGADKLSHAQQEYELQWVKRLHVSAPHKDKYRRMSVQLRNDLTSHYDLSNRHRHYVWVSFIEIYNEGIYDLLAPGERRNAQKLAIREDSSGNVYVKGATQAFVRSGEEAYDVMVAGKHNLQVAATGVHAQSSRSHCIFTITMLTEGDGVVGVSHVRLCDLAGCERAARTRNTGARMCESRAINSSLHVLERCLRALRRKGAKAPTRLVIPYRESKLTRLLGSGLSGARGEAVSMVVTLNPSPEYANETRHVLQLAAVAKDIQINNTISDYPSSLEDTSQDTTIGFNAEIMRLRSENERLHFELVQAQSRNKELLANMEQRQAAGAETMRELVSEAREITANYYEEQIKSLRDEMAEMAEEYESRLNATQLSKPETPSRNIDAKVNHLMTEIAILEEKLQAEKLARARAEEEVQHLRACIEERDEKPDEDPVSENVSLTDSDSDSEDDPCNESLEPTFRKEDINRSKLLRQSAVQDQDSGTDNSVLDKTSDTLRDESLGNETGKDKDDSDSDCSDRDSIGADSETCTVKKLDVRGTYYVGGHDEGEDGGRAKVSRETYCVADCDVLAKDRLNSTDRDPEPDNDDAGVADSGKKGFSLKDIEMTQDQKPNTFVNKIISSIKEASTSDSNNSLAQFERLELETKDGRTDLNATEVFADINILKEKRRFFDVPSESPGTRERKVFFDNLNAEPKPALDDIRTHIDDRSPSIVREEGAVEFTPSMIKKLLGDSKRQARNIAINSVRIYPKNHNSIDLFEDSPKIPARIENHIETIRKSIADLVVVDKVDAVVEETVGNENIRTCSVPIDIKTEENVMESTDINIENNDLKSTDEDRGNETTKKELVEEMNLPRDEAKCVKNEADDSRADDLNTNSLETKKIFTDKVSTSEKIKTGTEASPTDISHAADIKIERTEENIDAVKTTTDDSRTNINNNTLEEFDNIYKDITAPRATEFELLVSQEVRESSVEDGNRSNNNEESGEVKYNLRHKKTETAKSDARKDKEKPTRRNLRLRRRKNQSEDDDSEKEIKFKDIANLQTEFSDVTMDMPAPFKKNKDIPSPEKDDENLPPMMGIQSCPSKSVTRSRRKLFTPRAEPLDESGQADSNERVCVPRPSYHRPRARRKL
ncbi:hypothetical protein KGM_200599 [Danaus plexippus plexippus]|uniref:Uncharacterized protein n=1 Tax=Danaus plexippus plexippus TaxID=278856 RepID=A0A212FD18_DANPL|nr:hypothetical protein KGM_200599 [Danaus plexippus plexippus]